LADKKEADLVAMQEMNSKSGQEKEEMMNKLSNNLREQVSDKEQTILKMETQIKELQDSKDKVEETLKTAENELVKAQTDLQSKL